MAPMSNRYVTVNCRERGHVYGNCCSNQLHFIKFCLRCKTQSLMQCLIFLYVYVFFWLGWYLQRMSPPPKNSRRKISRHIFHLCYLKPFPKYLPSLFTRQNRNCMFSCCRFILGRPTTQPRRYHKLILFHTILIDMNRTLLFIVTSGLQPHMVIHEEIVFDRQFSCLASNDLSQNRCWSRPPSNYILQCYFVIYPVVKQQQYDQQFNDYGPRLINKPHRDS